MTARTDCETPDDYPTLYARALANALAEPAGSVPMGVLTAVCQSVLSISPFTTYTHTRLIHCSLRTKQLFLSQTRTGGVLGDMPSAAV